MARVNGSLNVLLYNIFCYSIFDAKAKEKKRCTKLSTAPREGSIKCSTEQEV